MMAWRVLMSSLVLFVVSSLTNCATSGTPVTSVSTIVSEVKPAVVYISIKLTGNSYVGSGMIIDKAGLVLTCSHVLADSSSPSITLSTGARLSGTVIARDDHTDLAIIRIPSTIELPAVLFGNSDGIDSGDDVIAIGYPLGLEGKATVTRGIVSTFREYDGVHYIQTDASISPGNSGGPLINSKGEVVGIVTSKIIREGVEGMAFAIAVNDAKSFISRYVEVKQTLPQQMPHVQSDTMSALEKEIFDLWNTERQNGGISLLSWNETCYQYAKRYAYYNAHDSDNPPPPHPGVPTQCDGRTHCPNNVSSGRVPSSHSAQEIMEALSGFRWALLATDCTQGAVGILNYSQETEQFRSVMFISY